MHNWPLLTRTALQSLSRPMIWVLLRLFGRKRGSGAESELVGNDAIDQRFVVGVVGCPCCNPLLECADRLTQNLPQVSFAGEVACDALDLGVIVDDHADLVPE